MSYRSSRSLSVAVVTCVFLLGSTSAALAFIGTIAVGLGRLNDVGEVKTAFAADAVLETEEMTVNTRIYYKPGAVRDEMKVGGQEMITIRHFEDRKVWMLMGRGMYMEIDADAGSRQAPDYKLVSREIVGPETINGMETTKYKSVYETKDGKFGGFTWYTEDNIAVKGSLVHESRGEKQRVKFEFTNLERGAQADSLFELPAGAQKLNIPGMPGMPNLEQMGGAGDRRGFGFP